MTINEETDFELRF